MIIRARKRRRSNDIDWNLNITRESRRESKFCNDTFLACIEVYLPCAYFSLSLSFALTRSSPPCPIEPYTPVRASIWSMSMCVCVVSFSPMIAREGDEISRTSTPYLCCARRPQGDDEMSNRSSGTPYACIHVYIRDQYNTAVAK